MSRSYKKTPWSGDKKGKEKKRIANHKMRQKLKNNLELIVQQGEYKKLYETWDICDFGWVTTFEEFMEREWKNYYWLKINFPNHSIEEPDEKQCYRIWLKFHRNK
jgi:hypothetical protein